MYFNQWCIITSICIGTTAFCTEYNNNPSKSNVLADTDEIYNNETQVNENTQSNETELNKIQSCYRALQDLIQQIVNIQYEEQKLSSGEFESKCNNFREQLNAIEINILALPPMYGDTSYKKNLFQIAYIYDKILLELANSKYNNIFAVFKAVVQKRMKEVLDNETEDNDLNSAQILDKYLDFIQEFCEIKEAISNIEVNNEQNILQMKKLDKIMLQYSDLLTKKNMGNDYNKLVDCKETYDDLKAKLVTILNQAKVKLKQIKNNVVQLETPDKKEQKKALWNKLQQSENGIINLEAILSNID